MKLHRLATLLIFLTFIGIPTSLFAEHGSGSGASSGSGGFGQSSLYDRFCES